MERRERHQSRVAHLTTVHNPRDPRIFHKQLCTLREAGFEVRLVAPRHQPATVKGIPIVPLPPIRERYWRLRLLPLAYRIARDQRAALYHFHDPELIPVAYLLKRATGARIIYDMHEDYCWHGPVAGRVIRTLERWCFSWADHVVLAEQGYAPIVESSSTSATVVENYFRPPEEEVAVTEDIHAPLRLLYAGVVGKGRGLYSMLELTRRLNEAGAHCELRIVGACYKAKEQKEGRQRIDALGDAATWAGNGKYIAPDAMPPHYRWADVGLALYEPDPNYLHSYPTKFYEYLHYGLPILCSDFPRWRRFVEKHACGAVVPPGDVEAAVQVLKRWQSHPDAYRTLSAAAHEASKQYEWEEMGTRLVQLYDDLLL